MSTHNLCFVQKYEKYLSFLSENFQFLEVKFSIYLNRRVFVMHAVLWLHFTRHLVSLVNAKSITNIFFPIQDHVAQYLQYFF